MTSDLFKIAVSVPEGYSEKMMDAIDGAMEPVHPGYRRAFSITRTTGTWIPTEGSHPFIGTVGSVERCDEIRIEFVVSEKDLRTVVRTIESVHPYEEPAIDVIPMIAWRSLL